MGSRRRPISKTITRVIVFLLLGAIVNVAVAWGLGLTSSLRMISAEPGPIQEWSWLLDLGWEPLGYKPPFLHKHQVVTFAGLAVTYRTFWEFQESDGTVGGILADWCFAMDVISGWRYVACMASIAVRRL